VFRGVVGQDGVGREGVAVRPRPGVDPNGFRPMVGDLQRRHRAAPWGGGEFDPERFDLDGEGGWHGTDGEGEGHEEHEGLSGHGAGTIST